MSTFGNLIGLMAYQKHARGDLANAKLLYERAILKGMNKPERYAAYGVLIMREGNFDKAIELFNKAITLHPSKLTRIKIRINRAIAYTKSGQYEQAKVALEDIHKKYRSVRVYESLGYFYVITNDDETEQYLLEAYEYDPDNYVILDNLCQYYLQKKDYEKAKQYGHKAHDADDNKSDNLYHLTKIYQHYGEMEKAKRYCEDLMGATITALNDISEEKRRALYKEVIGKDYDPDEI